MAVIQHSWLLVIFSKVHNANSDGTETVQITPLKKTLAAVCGLWGVMRLRFICWFRHYIYIYILFGCLLGFLHLLPFFLYLFFL